jgi:hypothetical protein
MRRVTSPILAGLQVATAFSLKRFSRALITLALACAGFSVNVSAQSPPSAASSSKLPPSVNERLRKNAAAMSAIHLEFSWDQSGSRPPYYAGPSTCFAYLDADRFYEREESPRHFDLGKVKTDGTQLLELAFDGRTYFTGLRDDLASDGAPWTMTKYSIDDKTDPERNKPFTGIRYLTAAGFYQPLSIADLATAPSIGSLVLHDLSQSGSTQVEQADGNLRVTVHIPDPILLDARRVNLERYRKELENGYNTPQHISAEIDAVKAMQMMAPTRTVAFLLDPNRGYAVVEREERTAAGKRLLHLTTDGWKQYESADVWLPERCVESNFTDAWSPSKSVGTPALTYTIQLTLAEFGQQHDVAVALDYKKPGTIVHDRTAVEARSRTNHELTYTVAADGATLLRGTQLARNETQGGRSVWIWINVTILAVIATAFLVRRWIKLRSA